MPVGRVGGAPAPDGQPYTFTAQLQGRLLNTADFQNLVLRNTGDGGLVRLKDVGRVELGGETYDISATDLRSVPSVGLAVYQLSGSNALEVSIGLPPSSSRHRATASKFSSANPIGSILA